jgi:hypothetical protein
MVKLGELRIESNIPLIVLALSVICVVVIGFLELKKITNRINELTIEVQNVKKNKIINEKNDEDLKEKQVLKENTENLPPKSLLTEENLKLQNIHENNIQGQKIKEQMKEKVKRQQVEEELIANEQMMAVPSPEEMIIGGLGFPHMMGQGGIASVILGGGPMMQMGEFQVQNMYEEDINPQEESNENQFEEINDDKSDEEDDLEEAFTDKEDDKSEMDEKVVKNDNIIINTPIIKKEESINEGNESDDDGSSIECSESDDYSDTETGSETDEETIELVQGKGKVEEIKEVDNSLSIKELKEICQKMGLSSSGNKETLIKRINSKK